MKTILEKLSKENTVLLKDEMKRINGGNETTTKQEDTLDSWNCHDTDITDDNGNILVSAHDEYEEWTGTVWP